MPYTSARVQIVLCGFADASDTSDEMTCVRDLSRHSGGERATSVRAEEPVVWLEHDLFSLGPEARGWLGRSDLPVHGEPPIVEATLRFRPPAADRVLAQPGSGQIEGGDYDGHIRYVGVVLSVASMSKLPRQFHFFESVVD